MTQTCGGEGNAGTTRGHGLAALLSQIEHFEHFEHFEHITRYHLIVLGDHVMAAEARYAAKPTLTGRGSDCAMLGAIEPSAWAVAIALKAMRLARLEFGGVDLLERV